MPNSPSDPSDPLRPRSPGLIDLPYIRGGNKEGSLLTHTDPTQVDLAPCANCGGKRHPGDELAKAPNCLACDLRPPEKVGDWFTTWLTTPRRPGRNAAPDVCARCHQVIVRGLDADRAAGMIACDPIPLDTAGELAAVIARRTTYDLGVPPARTSLNIRRAAHMARTDPFAITLAAHDCPAKRTGTE